jgi:hypothetical protein
VPGIARIGDAMNQKPRVIYPSRNSGSTPIVRRTFSGVAMVAAHGDDTRYPGATWRHLVSPVSSRTLVGALPVAMIGTEDSGTHVVVEGAARTIVGV